MWENNYNFFLRNNYCFVIPQNLDSSNVLSVTSEFSQLVATFNSIEEQNMGTLHQVEEFLKQLATSSIQIDMPEIVKLRVDVDNIMHSACGFFSTDRRHCRYFRFSAELAS